MQKHLANGVRKLFEKAILQLEIPFHKANGELIPPGCRLYRTDFETFAAFVLLLIIPKARGFTFEVSWARDGSYPAYNTPGSLDSVDPECGRLRAGEFLRQQDQWWYVRKAGEEGVQEAVGAATALLQGPVLEFLGDFESKAALESGLEIP